jgi:hypothetical protein
MILSPTIIENERKPSLDEPIREDRPPGGANGGLDRGLLSVGDG